MTHDEFLMSVLTDVCPGTKDAYPIGGAPPLPWFAYTHRRGGEFFADDERYAVLPRYQVELFYEENDPELVDRFEAALGRLTGTFSTYDDGYLESEGCRHVTYQLTLHPHKEREALNG